MIEFVIRTAQPVILNETFHDLDNKFKADSPKFTRVEREVSGNEVVIRYDFPASQLSNVSKMAFENAFKEIIGPGKLVEVRDDNNLKEGQ